MLNLNVQTSLSEVYESVQQSMEEDKPGFLNQVKEHIKIEVLIPREFYKAYYKDNGRPRGNPLESFIWYFLLRNIIGIFSDKAFLIIVMICREIREFCGFKQIPKESDITRFRESYNRHAELMFYKLVDITEPICREIDPKKSGYGIYDTSGMEAEVKENNPKFVNTKLEQAKKIAKNNPEYDPYKGMYSLLPETAEANPNVKLQHINGCFCYAQKFGIFTNGLGIVRHLSFFDEIFKALHPEIVSQKTDNPDLDKEIADSKSLNPVLLDFFAAHPHLWRTYHTFLGDSSFDSYDIYPMLRDDFHFKRMCIPMNARNSSNAHADFDDYGIPVCPIDKTPFTFQGVCRGKNRSVRYKFVCHKSVPVTKQSACTCDTPCTPHKYGRCSYVYPDKNLRLYPGIPRGTEHWKNLYRHRTLVERTINIFKHDFGLAHHRTFSVSSAKFELFFAGITQLVGVILAKAINQPILFKSVRKLISA